MQFDSWLSRSRGLSNSAIAPDVARHREVLSYLGQAFVLETSGGFQGGDVRFFEAPVRKHAAGLLDGDPGVAPDQHIFVDYAASWDEITDARLQCTERYVTNMRKAEWKEKRGRWSRS